MIGRKMLDLANVATTTAPNEMAANNRLATPGPAAAEFMRVVRPRVLGTERNGSQVTGTFSPPGYLGRKPNLVYWLNG